MYTSVSFCVCVFIHIHLYERVSVCMYLSLHVQLCVRPDARLPPLPGSVDMTPHLSVVIDVSIAVQHVYPLRDPCTSVCIVSI